MYAYSSFISFATVFVVLTCCVCIMDAANINESFNEDLDPNKNLSTTMWRNGMLVHVEEGLAQKLEEESYRWHWLPWHYPRTALVNNVLNEILCIPSSVETYPDSIFTVEQIRTGGFILYALMGLCTFTLLAVVCNDYFIPCVEYICEDLSIPQHVAAATFMAAATSMPELFINLISTLLAESDMGVGTIVGSALFNTLGVACVGSLAAIIPIKIDKRPVIRDCIIYLFNVAVLLVIVWDGQISWYESTVLVILYILYFVLMFNSDKLFTVYDWVADKTFNKKNFPEEYAGRISRINSGIEAIPRKYSISHIDVGFTQKKRPIEVIDEKKPIDEEDPPEVKFSKSLWRFPSEKSTAYKVWWAWSWPEKLILTCTIPSPKTQRRWYPLAFFNCIVWIGAASYLVSWSVAVIGAAFFIPDSVMGMTFLAFGACVPEACSIFIMSRKARGDIGVSNAIGANSLAIVFSLGCPWFIKCMIGLGTGTDSNVVISSEGIGYIVAAIPVAVVSLIVILTVGKYTLKKGTGFALMVVYLIVITYTILVETGVIFIDALPSC